MAWALREVARRGRLSFDILGAITYETPWCGVQCCGVSLMGSNLAGLYSVDSCLGGGSDEWASIMG